MEQNISKKRKIKFFVSYARSNLQLASELLEKLRENLASSKAHSYGLWRDQKILIGADWEQSIKNALSECDAGLLLISPAFLSSQYIKRKELPALLGEEKLIVPVMLKEVDFEFHDLLGLERAQIFMRQYGKSEKFKAYSEYKRKGPRRDSFALDLFREIEKKLAYIA